VIGDVLQPTHLIFILVIALIVLGPKRLPEVGRSLGKGIRDFRGALSGADDPEPSEPEPPATVSSAQPITPATTTVTEEPAPEPMVRPVEVEQVHARQMAEPDPVAPEAGTKASIEADESQPPPVAPVADSTQRP
jgi:sec-independent protein translocase protein TatA